MVKHLTEIAHVNALAAGRALIEMLKFAFWLSTNSNSFNPFARVFYLNGLLLSRAHNNHKLARVPFNFNNMLIML
jgi:hypothetical protein